MDVISCANSTSQEKDEKDNNTWDIIRQLSEKSSVPKLPFLPEEKEISDYNSYFTSPNEDTRNALEILEQILIKLKNEDPIEHENHMKFSLISKSKCWTYLFITLSEYCEESKPWSSASIKDVIVNIDKEIKRITNLASKTSLKWSEKKVLNSIAAVFQYEFSNEISPRKSIFRNILSVLREKLKRDIWKYYPAAIFSFQQLVYCVAYPDLSAYADEVLPIILLFIDDYYDENKLMGMQLLNYTIKNLNKAELLRKNWAEVLYSTVLRSVTEKHPKTVNDLASILFRLLEILGSVNICTQTSKYDETLKQILFALEFCSDIDLRIVWMPHLIELIKIMGHSTLRWIDRICQMLLDFTTCSNVELWMWILKCTAVCIKNTWLKPKSEIFVEIILRVVFNASVFDIELFTDDSQSDLYFLAKECLLLLKNCEDYKSVDSQITEIINCNALHPKFLHTLKTIYF